MSQTLVQRIDALLPQTQCGKCGHPGCRPYAEGIAQGEAINKCPPGGQVTLIALADLLQVPVLPLDAPNGPVPPQIAFIREAECIGCTKCIQACPVDAIVGAARQMHTVIRDECTGCELCVAPCPVDCIDILPLAEPDASAQRERADQFRQRFEQRNARLARDEARRQAEREARAQRQAHAQEKARSEAAASLDPVQAAIERVKAQKAAAGTLSDEQKRLKVEAAMARVALSRAQKQYATYGTSDLAAQVAELKAASERAEAALARASAAPAPVTDEAALKKAKIEAAMSRAQLAKAQKAYGAEPDAAQQAQLTALQQAVDAAEATLTRLQAAQPTTPPSPGEAALKQAKVALVTRRGALRSAEARGADEAELAPLRQALADAETALHAAEDACGKAAPELQRIDKRPVDPALRALKTELAMARAEVSRLERRQPRDEAAVGRAQARLADAERRLGEHPEV